jgi:hypothetical protein
MLVNKSANAAAARGLRSSGLPSRAAAAAAPQRNVIVRFREDKRPASASDPELLKEQLSGDHKGPKDPKITPEQMEQVSWCCSCCHCPVSCLTGTGAALLVNSSSET